MKLNRNIQGLWFLLFPCLLFSSVFVSWHALSKVNFLYNFWYENTQLESFIDHYAPLNRYKDQFENTDQVERVRLFAEIVASINKGGQGLGEISYRNPQGELIDSLLRQSEVEHLEYVANLISFLNYLGSTSIFLSLSCLGLLIFFKVASPVLKKTLGIYALIVFLLFLIVMVVGPLNVFVFLHELAFPKGHQWFFYYQDSLMTTLMMAPDLFAYFAAVWVGLSILFFVTLVLSIERIFQQFAK